MGQNTAPQRHQIAVGEVRNHAVSFADVLDAGELLTGTPTVAEQTTSDLTISNEAVSTSALTINHNTVPAYEAVQFSVSDQKAATAYKIKITVSTDATPAQTLVKYVEFDGVTE